MPITTLDGGSRDECSPSGGPAFGGRPPGPLARLWSGPRARLQAGLLGRLARLLPGLLGRLARLLPGLLGRLARLLPGLLGRLQAGLLALLIALPATIAALAVGHAPARAAVPDEWGFAVMDDETPAPGQPLDPTRSWGSWKTTWPAAQVRVWPDGVGQYVVRFPFIATTRGVVHVTAIANEPRWCQIIKTGSTGVDLDVIVRCYRHGGAEHPSRFAVMIGSSSGQPFNAGAYAYTRVSAAGDIIDEYNSTGGANDAGMGSPGYYKVYLPGVTGSFDPTGGLQITAEEPDHPRRCKVSEWYPGPTALVVVVRCYDETGMPAESGFHLTYQNKRSIFGGLAPPDNLAYLLTSALGTDADYNSQGAVNTVTASGAGLYLVWFPKVGIRETHVQVTAYGTTPDYCLLQEVWGIPDNSVVVRNVICFDEYGHTAKNDFFVTTTSRV